MEQYHILDPVLWSAQLTEKPLNNVIMTLKDNQS